MKILVGAYQCESNTFATLKAFKKDFKILNGQDVIDKLSATKTFLDNGFEVVPMVYAVALPSGMVEKQSYLEILNEFLEVVKQNKDTDGIYIYFHGAMYVDGIGSGEEYCVKEIRKILGEDVPISIASDFHSNISDGLASNVNAISGYRTAPHTDYDETEKRAANALMEILNNQLSTRVMLFRVPVLLADAAVTGNEPYKSIMAMLDEVDTMDNVVACSVYNGQPWVDAEYVGASVVISYFGDDSSVYEAGKRIADTFWTRREEFCFEVPALSPSQAIQQAKTMEKPVIISDSGDNTTAGAEGKSTFFLEKLMKSDLKKVLVCGLFYEDAVKSYKNEPVGTSVSFKLNPTDDFSHGCQIDGVLKESGIILGFVGEEAGEGILVSCGNVDIIFSDVRTAFISKEHFERMNTDINNYDYVVLKMGYLWPKVKVLAKNSIFALTPGTSTNDFKTLKYTKLNGNYFSIK